MDCAHATFWFVSFIRHRNAERIAFGFDDTILISIANEMALYLEYKYTCMVIESRCSCFLKLPPMAATRHIERFGRAHADGLDRYAFSKCRNDLAVK